MEERRSHGGPRKKGGLVTMPFIFGKLWHYCWRSTNFFSFLFSSFSSPGYCFCLLLMIFCSCCFSCVANEASEKLAVVGFNTNMISYLTSQLHMPSTKAANTLTNFGGTASLTPLLGAFISDAYAGRFWTITVASIIYQIVKHLSLSLSATLYKR